MVRGAESYTVQPTAVSMYNRMEVVCVAVVVVAEAAAALGYLSAISAALL